MTFQAGHVHSHYRIECEIGRGGMGVVYRALDTRLNRRVAIKVLSSETVHDEDHRRRFVREARAAAAVTHPHIAAVHEIDEVDGVAFIVMELVEGVSLQELIRGRPLDLPDALRLGAEIAEALARAHGAGIVHRDIKPGNIMIDRDHHAKILDFGLARLAERREELSRSLLSEAETLQRLTTAQGRILGTPSYMSPEQARGEPVDSRSDLFSLGATLYQMVTGHVPFQGHSQIEVLTAILRDPVPPASTISGGIPRRLDDILAKCLEKNPADRYQHADELMVDLRHATAGSPEAASQAVSVPQGRGRRRAMALGAAAILLLGLGLAAGAFMQRAGNQPGAVPSIAVLPLENLSGDPNEEYFAEGMTDALISGLSKVRALRVISRSSVSRYKAASRSLPAIARDLRVEAVLEGSVMHAGGMVRVTAQLVDVAADRNVWSETYERNARDVLAIQNDVTRDVVRGIRATLTPQEEAEISRAREVDPEAFRLYLKGRFLFDQWSHEEFLEAIAAFRRAIQIDPVYSQAYAGLADTYYGMSNLYMPPHEAIPKAKAAALKALELDPDLADGHTSLGLTRLFYDWDLAGAEREFLQAIRLEPGNFLPHRWYAALLAIDQRCEEAAKEVAITLDLDPLTRFTAVLASDASRLCRQFDRALEMAKRAHADHGDDPFVFQSLGLAYLAKGEKAAAVDFLRRVKAMLPDSPANLAVVAQSLALVGEGDEAREMLAALEEMSRTQWVPASSRAAVHLALGDEDRAFELFEAGVVARDEELVFLGVDPRFDRSRSTPRFQKLLRRIGLAPAGAPAAPPVRDAASRQDAAMRQASR